MLKKYILLLAVGVIFQCAAQNNGQVIETAAYQFPVFSELPGWMKKNFTEETYSKTFSKSEMLELKRIQYYSDGLKVAGFIYQPKVTQGKLPVIIYNRPGVGEAAKIGNNNFRLIYEMQRCAASGFIVVASQYRGIDGSEGKDEVCGGDVNDVLNLLPLIQNMKQADVENIFMWGSSRGGTMALQAMRSGFPVRAVALVGAVTDWGIQLKHGDHVARESWPEYESRKQEHIAKRSAVQWVPELATVPVLILQGGNDTAVEPAQALVFAEKMQENCKLFELAVYSNDDHLLTKNQDRKIDQVIDWFKKPRLASIAKDFNYNKQQQGIEFALSQYKKIKEKNSRFYDFSESELNNLGYTYLFTGQEKDAVRVFQLNTEVFPASAAAWDSLGEAYAKTGDHSEASRCYKRVLELDPGNKSATEALKNLKN